MTYGLFIVPFNSAWLRIMPYKVGKIRSHLLGLTPLCQVKTFSWWFSRLMGLPLKLQLWWFSIEAIDRYTVGSTDGMVVTRGSGECGLGLLLGGWDWLQYLCSVGWSWAKVPYQSAQVRPQSVSLFLGLWIRVTPTRTLTRTPTFYTLLCVWWKLLSLLSNK